MSDTAAPPQPFSPWTPSRSEWKDRLDELLDGKASYRLDQLWSGLYDHGVEPAEITNLSKALRSSLAEVTRPSLTMGARRATADGKTVKWLSTMADGVAVETVLMHYPGRSTVCVSSQAGCAMGCGFCATGQGGYDRNLTVGEILEQIVTARREADPRRLSNIVFMGMGEPFANYDRVIECLGRITGDLGIGARHITVSTIGLVPQMLRFAEERLQVGLAVSLHAADDDLRSELIPVNKRHPIEDLVAASQLFRERTGRRVSFEWAMIHDVNDRDLDADRLADVANRARAHVNLIPLNPTPGWPTVGSSPARIEAFVGRLRQRGVNATVRRNRGTDIDAACGQLAASDRSPTPVEVRSGPPTAATPAGPGDDE